MHKKEIVTYTVVIGVMLIGLILLMVYSPSQEEIYQSGISQLQYRKNLCESAGFTYEQDGELTKPGRGGDINLGGEYVTTGCYDLKNNVRVYQNWNSLKYHDALVSEGVDNE